VGRHGVDLLLAARAQEREVLRLVELQVVEARDGRGGHDVAPVHEHGMVGPGGGGVEAHDLVEQLQPRARVVRLGMQAARGGLARLEAAQRLGRGHLQHEHLVGAQGTFGNPVARLDERGVLGGVGHLHVGGVGHKLLDVHGVHAVVRALVDHLEHVAAPDDGQRDLQAARAPAAADGHLAGGEGHLVAGDGNALHDGAADLALGRLVEEGVVITLLHRSPPSLPAPQRRPGRRIGRRQGSRRAYRARWKASIGTSRSAGA